MLKLSFDQLVIYDLKAVTLMRALSPWVYCAFGNVYVIVHSLLIVEEKIIFSIITMNIFSR